MSKEEEIKEKEKELNKLKLELKAEKEAKALRKKAGMYFDNNFCLSRISDNYDFIPEEIYSQCRESFLRQFGEDESFNVYNLKEQRGEYLALLRNNIEDLKIQLKRIEEEYKEVENE